MAYSTLTPVDRPLRWVLAATLGVVFTIALVAVAPTASQGAEGTWERAWGKDVVAGGTTGFEVCTRGHLPSR